jgi:hypothetical protein
LTSWCPSCQIIVRVDNLLCLKKYLVIFNQESVALSFQATSDDSLSLVEFDRKRAIPRSRFAIASLDEGKAVIPVWLDVIYQQLLMKLELNKLNLKTNK